MRRPIFQMGLLAALLAAPACADSPVAPTVPRPEATPVLVALPARAGSLVVESFSVIEYQYPGYPGWYYAPQVVVSSPDDGSGVDVGLLDLTVAGLGDAPPVVLCRRVANGTRVSLLNEIYGDYELSISQGAVRASAPEATISISFTDGLGSTATVTASGPVVAGELPKTYTGGTTPPCR